MAKKLQLFCFVNSNCLEHPSVYGVEPVNNRHVYCYRSADNSLTRPGRKQATATEDLMFIYPIYNHNWRNISSILYIYIYITRQASNEIFSPSNKIHREVGRVKDLSALLYL
jgi:hypothetical protein